MTTAATMTDARLNCDQRVRVDDIVSRYHAAHVARDYAYLAEVWGITDRVPGLEAALHQLHEGIIEEAMAR